MVDSEYVKAVPVLEPAGRGENVRSAHVTAPKVPLPGQLQHMMPGGRRLRRERSTGVSSEEMGIEGTARMRG